LLQIFAGGWEVLVLGFPIVVVSHLPKTRSLDLAFDDLGTV
jgi:hypothetical protein